MRPKSTFFKIGNNILNGSDTKVYWENKILNSQVENPTKIKYGISPIEIDMFTVGTNFRIQLQNESNSNLNISIKSYFGIGRDKKYEQYQQITDAICDRFFVFQFGEIVNRWENGQTIRVGKFLIDSQGITKKLGSLEVSLGFDEMQLFERFDHLLINSTLESDKFIRLNYLDDWNWPLIYEILKVKLAPTNFDSD